MDNYFINELQDKNKSLNILWMSYESYTENVRYINNMYNNCNIDIYGDSIFYAKNKLDCNIYEQDYDLIMFYSSILFRNDELEMIEEIAKSISIYRNKKVTIGYSYIVPKEERKNCNYSDEIKIVSFYNYNRTEENIGFKNKFFNTINLMDVTLEKHNSTNIKTKKRRKI